MLRPVDNKGNVSEVKQLPKEVDKMIPVYFKSSNERLEFIRNLKYERKNIKIIDGYNNRSQNVVFINNTNVFKKYLRNRMHHPWRGGYIVYPYFLII